MTTRNESFLTRGRSEGRRRIPDDGRSRGSGRNEIMVARGAGLVVIRVVGSGNMVTAPILSEFVERQRDSGYRKFVFDMKLCRGLDSTFMGCMVGLCSTQFSQGDSKASMPSASTDYEELEVLSPNEAVAELQAYFDRAGGATEVSSNHGKIGFVIAVNVSAECQELMNILGVDNFVQIRGEADLGDLEMESLPEREMPIEERRQLILTAHENLIEIDKRNEAKFGAFLRSLSEELAK